MGQYHQVYNLTKKETFTTRGLGDGAKLLEWGCGGAYTAGLAVLLCNSNGRGGGDLNIHHDYKRDENGKYIWTPVQALQSKIVSMVAGRWAGDKIVVQGDYAEKGDKGFISAKQKNKYTDITELVAEALSVDAYLRDQINKNK